MTTIEDALAASAAAHAIPGFVAMAILDGRVLHQSARGARGVATAEPMTVDTVFRIFSMTKAVTTVAVLQLVEQGRVDLDEPAVTYLPGLAAIQVLDGFDAAGAPVLRAPKRPPTVRHLLSHTSGYAYDMWNTDLVRYIAATGLPGMGTGLNAALDMPLMFDPGEHWEYGIGVDWAGKLVEAVSGQMLDAYFADHIFEPLGMDSTGFVATPSMTARMAGLSFRAPDGGLQPLDLPAAPGEFFGGGGGLLGTAGDYLKFLRALAGDGAVGDARILRPETVDLMGQADAGAPPVRRLPTANPFLTHDLDIWGERTPETSLGFMVNPQVGPHGRGARSLAWAGLANTYYWVDRSRRLAGVFMTQMFPFADPDALAIFADFERATYGALAS